MPFRVKESKLKDHLYHGFGALAPGPSGLAVSSWLLLGRPMNSNSLQVRNTLLSTESEGEFCHSSVLRFVSA